MTCWVIFHKAGVPTILDIILNTVLNSIFLNGNIYNLPVSLLNLGCGPSTSDNLSLRCALGLCLLGLRDHGAVSVCRHRKTLGNHRNRCSTVRMLHGVWPPPQLLLKNECVCLALKQAQFWSTTSLGQLFHRTWIAGIYGLFSLHNNYQLSKFQI